MAKIENHKFSIQEAFNECFYVVPDYQREYVWTEKEVRQLLDDIDEQIDTGRDREYFIGMVLVSPTKEKNQFEVIDGQQRLTTLFLLLCALRYRFRGHPPYAPFKGLLSTEYVDTDGNTKSSLRLEPRYENAAELMKLIVTVDADPVTTRAKIAAAGIQKFGSLEKLVEAYSTVHRILDDNYDDVFKLQRYWGYLANNVVFIQISTDMSSALKIFETINERGVGLNPMDLLKNLLFKHVEANQFSELKDNWKKITAPLEKAKEKPLRFLRYFLMANYKIKNERNDHVVREDEIYDWFVNKENAELCNYKEQPFEFVRKIIQNVDCFLNYTQGRGNDGSSNLALKSMQLLCGGAFSLHYILLLAARALPKLLFDHFVVQLESFLFYYIFTKTPTKDLERNFSLWADELREICALTDEQMQIQRLDQFIVEKLQKNMDSKDAELTDALRRFSLQSMQQYRTRYLLAKFTQFVDMAWNGIKMPLPLNNYTILEIEHILPDNPETDLRTSFAKENPDKDYDIYKNKLGNLTMLEKPINIVASNRFFEEKKPKYQDSGNYLTRSIVELKVVGKNSSINRINEKLIAFKHWSAADIDRRQEMLIRLAKEIWKTAAMPAG